MSALLEMRGIVRRFGVVRANDGVDLDVGAGEILGLLGENGSGKSTLMKVLFGMTKPDAGEIRFLGRALEGHRPADAMAAGIAMIHQHFMLIEAMTVVENVMLGWPQAGRVLRTAEMAERVREASRRFGLDLDPQASVGQLSLGRRQRLEILKAVLRDARLLILDEPTSNLAPSEVADLLSILRRLRAEGKGVVFISHKLPEVLEVCDRVVVLRAGRVSGSAAIGDVTRAQLAEMMVGRDVTTPHVATTRAPGAPRLSVAGLRGSGLGPLSFEVRGGEILGVAGVDGNGQIELAETLAGLRRPHAGAVTLDGHDVTRASVAARMRAGMAYMPADRSSTALVRAMTIAENMMLRDSGRPPYAKGHFLARRALMDKARALMSEYDVRAPGPQTVAARLSGGNQQKIVVARELDRRPAVLVAHQAAWGLDPGATRFVLERVLALREAGAAVVYFSSELEEVLEISDRIAVLAGGGFAGVTTRDEADLRQIGLWMSGARGMSEATPQPASGEPRAALRIPLRLRDREGMTLRVVVAAALSVLCAAALVALSGKSPFAAFGAMALGAVGSPHQIGVALNRATPYLLAGSGVAICFRAGIINIGAEGQIAIGGAGAAAVALIWPGGAPALMAVASLVGAAIVGALWAAVATAIHLGRRVHEVLATLLLNFVALLLVQQALAGPLGQFGAGFLQSPQLPSAAWLWRLPDLNAHIGFLVAFAAAAGLSLVLWRTPFGFALRVAGASRPAAAYAGFSLPALTWGVMLLAGALAGLAGGVEVLGVHHRLIEGFSTGFGFKAVTVALLGALEPLAVIPASLFVGLLEAGSLSMQRQIGVPSALVVVIEGLTMLFVLAATVRRT